MGKDQKNIRFLETIDFIKQWEKLQLTEDELNDLKHNLAANPYLGDVISGTNGLRKLRIGIKAKRLGKRGGARVCYVDFIVLDTIVLLQVYEKNQKSDLTSADKKVIAQKIAELEKILGTPNEQTFTRIN